MNCRGVIARALVLVATTVSCADVDNFGQSVLEAKRRDAAADQVDAADATTDRADATTDSADVADVAADRVDATTDSADATADVRPDVTQHGHESKISSHAAGVVFVYAN